MRPPYFLLLLIFMTISLNCTCEITKGFSNILLEANGNVSFSLINGTQIICGVPDRQWEEIIVCLPSSKEYFDGVKKLKKGDILINSAGNKVCVILSDSVKYTPMHNTETNKYVIRLFGYIPLQNIEVSSIPENILEKLLVSKKNILSFDELKNFIRQFHFYKLTDFIDDKKYTCYFYYADYFWDNNISLVFENHSLIAVLHTRELKLSGVKNIKTDRENLLWLKSNSDNERSNFIKKYLRNFEKEE